MFGCVCTQGSGNKFSDLTYEEFKAKVLMRSRSKDLKQVVKEEPQGKGGRSRAILANAADAASTPQQVDHRTMGHVSPVKDQGLCGSCCESYGRVAEW